MNKDVVFRDLGITNYQEAWDLQTTLFDGIVAQKLRNREQGTGNPAPNYLLFTEHRPVYTLGRNGDAGHLLVRESELKKAGVSLFRTNRGGDIADPWYTGNFDETYRDVSEGCEGLLAHILKEDMD